MIDDSSKHLQSVIRTKNVWHTRTGFSRRDLHGTPRTSFFHPTKKGRQVSPLEGTGTRPDYLVNLDEKKLRGIRGKTLQKNREIVGQYTVEFVGA